MGDLVSITASGLKTDADGDGVFENTWALTDYQLYPPNAALDGQPYSEIRTASGGAFAFPSVANGVQVNGVHGHALTTPPVIESACLFQCALDFHAKDAPEGVSGSGGFQEAISAAGLHPFTKRMIFPYKRLVAA